jgi:hypothetical protein
MSSELLAQKFWREIRAVRPDERVQLAIQAELPKHFDAPERLENRPLEIAREIDFSARAILEPNPDAMAGNIVSLYESSNHCRHSRGSIRGSGIPARARFQASISSA